MNPIKTITELRTDFHADDKQVFFVTATCLYLHTNQNSYYDHVIRK